MKTENSEDLYGISDDREHITWFSFEGEFAGDYPACLVGHPSQTTIEAMVPTRVPAPATSTSTAPRHPIFLSRYERFREKFSNFAAK